MVARCRRRSTRAPTARGSRTRGAGPHRWRPELILRFGISLLNFRPGRVGGAETYIRRLLGALPKVAGKDDLVVVAHSAAAASVDLSAFQAVIVDRNDAALIGARVAEAYTGWRDRAVERVFVRLALDAALFPQQSIFPKRVAVPAVLTAVDVQHLFFPENFGAFDRTFRAAIYPASVRRADRIIAISEYTRRTLIERAGAPADKVVTIPFGFESSETAAVPPTDRMRGPYLYYPAATFPHKDHATLFRSFAALHRQGAISEPLVLTGARTREWRNLERLAADLGIADRVHHLGFLPFDEVRRVYAGASAVLFPTRFEGFGLPVLEATAAGKKVIASRLAVFDEIGLPRAWQIDFADPAQLLAALRRPDRPVLARPPLTWEDNARATLAELRRAARG